MTQVSFRNVKLASESRCSLRYFPHGLPPELFGARRPSLLPSCVHFFKRRGTGNGIRQSDRNERVLVALS